MDTYLDRTLARLEKEGLEDGNRRIREFYNDALKRGIQPNDNSRTFVHVRKLCEEALRDCTIRMARIAFEVEGRHDEATADAVKSAALRLRDALGELYRSKNSKGHRSVRMPDTKVAEFATTGEAIVTDIVDDFQHGMLEGKVLAKDPPISIVSNITNSPGAVQQAGIGNTQTVITVDNAEALREALNALLASPQYQELSPDERAQIGDLAVSMQDELAKPTPDGNRLRRLGRRLLDLSTQFGISVAAGGVSAWLFG